MKLKDIIHEAKQNEDIIGLWVGGSHGKGYADKYSDYDIWIFLTEDAYKQRQKDGKQRKVFDADFEIFYTTINEVSKFPNMHFAFENAKPIIDKTDKLQKLMNKIGTFPKDKKDEIIGNELNAYCNALFYSLKAMRRNNLLGGVLEATQSIEHLLIALFAIHGKYKPYDSYIDKELHKLTKIKSDNLGDRVYKIITIANVEEQRILKQEMEKLFRQEGHSMVFDAWDKTSTWQEVLKP